jgi:hypothetical protein
VAIKNPKVLGVIFFTKKEFVGLLPANTLKGVRNSISFSDFLLAVNSATTSAFVFPFNKASVCAK